MDLLLINKERKRICFISILFTLIFVSFYVISVILFSSISIFIPLIGALILLVLLYLLSSLYVMKKYMSLKSEVIYYALKRDLKVNKIKSSEEKRDYLYNFYKKENLNFKSKLTLYYDSHNIELEEFEITNKRDFKSNKVVLAGKHIKINLFKNVDDVVFIKSHEQETEKYVDFHSYIFNKKDDNFSFNKKRYVCMYNTRVYSDILSVLEKFQEFHMLSIKDGVVDIIFIDKTPIFDFKLQKAINQSTVSYCESCFNKTVKLINLLRKVEEKNV